MENIKQLSMEETLMDETDIEKVKRKMPKTLIIPIDESIIESNFAEIPFINYYKTKEAVLSVEYVWNDSKGNNYGIEVRGSKYGVPSSDEFDVLLALFRIYSRKNSKFKLNKESNSYDIPIEIEFTYRELAKEMGYQEYGGTVHKNLVKSIETLIDTTIYNKASGGLYDANTKNRISNSKISYHIIESSIDETIEVSKNKFHEKSIVKINNFFYRSIRNNYLRKFDYRMLLSLKVDIAKKIMLILNKWKNQRSAITIYYSTLYERIPLPDTKTVSYRNKRIKEAAEDLVRVGFIDKYITFPKEKKITFVFDVCSSDDTGHDDKTYCAKDKFNTWLEISEGLKYYGVPDDEIENLDLSKLSDIKAWLRLCHLKNTYSKLDNKYSYFSKGYDNILKGKCKIDKKFYD